MPNEAISVGSEYRARVNLVDSVYSDLICHLLWHFTLTPLTRFERQYRNRKTRSLANRL